MNVRKLTIYSGVALITLTSLCNAQIIPVSLSYQLTASGSARVPQAYGGEQQSYSVTHAQSGDFLSSSDGVSGTALANITIMPPFELYLGTELRVASSASQTTSILSNEISIDCAASAGSWMNSQVGSLGSYGHASVTVVFAVLEPVSFSLTGSGWHYQSDYPYTQSNASLSLMSASGGTLYQHVDQGHYFGGPNLGYEPITGILAPGQYTFSTDISGVATGDPIGESGSGQFDVTLHVASVPEQTSTVLFVVIGIFALFAIKSLPRPRLAKCGGRTRD